MPEEIGLIWPPIPGLSVPYHDATYFMTDPMKQEALKVQDPQTGNTALHWGVIKEQSTLIRDLIKICDYEDLSTENHQGWSPWMLALEKASQKLYSNQGGDDVYPILKDIHDKYYPQSRTMSLTAIEIVEYHQQELHAFKVSQTYRDLDQETASVKQSYHSPRL